MKRLESLPIIELGYEQVPLETTRMHLGENHIPFNQQQLHTIANKIDAELIQNYPEQAAHQLQHLIKQTFNLPQENSLLFGNGSSDLINCLFQTFCLPHGRVMTAEPDFFLYRRLAKVYGCDYHSINFDDNHHLDIKAMVSKARAIKPTMIILSNPNNPLACEHDIENIKYLLENVECPVVIDEAYFAYANNTAMPLISAYNNLIVIQSLSKIGFAGIRFGYLCAQQSMLNTIKKVLLPFNVSALSIVAVASLLEDKNIIEKRIAEILQQRRMMIDAIQQSKHLTCDDTHTNFINIKIMNEDAKLIYQKLLAKGIKTTFVNMPQLIENSLRVSVDCQGNNNKLLEELINV